MKKIVKGNDFTLRIPVMKSVGGQKVPFPLPACTDVQVRVCNQFKRIDLSYEVDVEQDHIILARVEGDKMPVGTYAIEVRGKIFGNDWRSEEYPQFEIVARNADADTEFGETDEGDNSVDMDTALVILPPSVELTNLISDSEKSLSALKTLNDSVSTEEEKRAEAEKGRASAEEERVDNEKQRSNAEELRVLSELDRKSAEQTREDNEDKRKHSASIMYENEQERTLAEETRVSQESARNAAEVTRNTNEEKRESSEATRADSERKRVEAENERIENENARIEAENARKEAETKRETAISNAVSDAGSKVDTFIADSTKKITESLEENKEEVSNFVTTNQEKVDTFVEQNQAKVDAAVSKVGTDTQTAIDDLTSKVNASIEKNDAAVKKATDDFTAHSAAFDDAEGERVQAETARVNAEEQREATLAKTKADCEAATDAAKNAASEATLAKTKAEVATSSAEKVNVELFGSEISVTNRDGETKSIDVIGPGEKVVVYVSSSVDGLSVAGLKINVYLNNGKTPQTYTTDSEGIAKFEVDRGNYYEVVFPEYGNAQPITPVGYTSVLGARDIRVEYKPYSMDETEEATISVVKYNGNDGVAFVGASVSVTIGNDTREYSTDENGKVFVYVPYGKDYTVSVKDQDGYNVRYAKNERTFTAKLPKRSIAYTMYQYKTGILVVDDSLNEYYIDDWLADGKSPDDAMAIRVAEQQLVLNGGSFLFRISDLKNVSKIIAKQWCTQNIQFNDIALNGNNLKDENYYRGETSSYLIRQEAEQRSLSVPAFDYAYNEHLVLGDRNLRGFIMSVGQEYIHIANRVEIGEVLRKLFGDEIADAYLAFVTSKNRWTSTQNSATGAWYYSSQANTNVKASSFYVLPAFAC